LSLFIDEKCKGIFAEIKEFVRLRNVKINYGRNETFIDGLFYDAFYGDQISNFKELVYVAFNQNSLNFRSVIVHFDLNSIAHPNY